MTKDNSTGKPKDFYNRGQQMFDRLNLPDDDDDDTQVYAKPWQELTDEEVKAALVSVDPETKRLPPGLRDFARSIESKLKEKNT